MIAAPSPTALRLPASGVAATLLGRSGWSVVLLVWAAYALWQGLVSGGVAIERMSTDDAMRLAEVRDLLAGQGWFDLTQRRLDPPGVLMHWSRLIDLPIAALLSAAELVTSPEAALRVTLTVWPSILMLLAMLACASASAAVAGPVAGAASAVMFVLSPGLLVQFGPGTIDHHGAQMALTLIMLAAAMRIRTSRFAGVVAGLAAAAMTAIGMETAPHLVACAGFVALRWAVEGEAVARETRRFGLTFGGATAALAMASAPPQSWGAPVCDAIGVGHVVVAAFGGFGLATATILAPQGARARFIALGGVALAAFAAIAAVAPDCLTTPYGALPERLKAHWLDHVGEAQSFVATARADPASGFAIGAALLGAVAAALWMLVATKGETRWRVSAAVAMLAAACAVTLWQIRGTSLAFAAAATLLPAAAVAIGRSGGWARLLLAVAALSPATLAAAGLGVAGIVGAPPVADGERLDRVCPTADYRALARATPGGLALNSIYSGPFLLAGTSLSAVAAPYHRNVDGLTAAVDAFRGSQETARAIALSRGAAYVVVCDADSDVRLAAKDDPTSFAALLLSGAAPAWLTPIDLGPGAKLSAWRVRPRD